MIFQPRDLLKQYEKLDKDPLLFMHWMKKQCQANSGHAKKTFDVVKDLNPSEKDVQAKKSLTANASSLLIKNPHSKCKSLAVISSQSTPYSTAPESKAIISIEKPKVITVNSTKENNKKETGGKDGLNQHLVKLREQFTTMHDIANKKMLELQLELTKMQHMSHEFDVLAEFLSSEEKLSSFEQKLDRLQKTVLFTEGKLKEINTNNNKMGEMIRQINETAKMQHKSNEKAINAIGARLTRWESKLDRVAKQMCEQKIDFNDLKSNGDDYGQLKNDIETMLNNRMNDLSTDTKIMIFVIISLIILKTILFDVMFKKGDDAIAPE